MGKIMQTRFDGWWLLILFQWNLVISWGMYIWKANFETDSCVWSGLGFCLGKGLDSQDLWNKCFEDSTHEVRRSDHSGPSGGPIERWRTRTRCCWMMFRFPMWMLGGLVVAGYSGYIVLHLIMHQKIKFRKKHLGIPFFCEGWFHLVPECFRHFRTFDVGLSLINSFPTKSSLDTFWEIWSSKIHQRSTFLKGFLGFLPWQLPLNVWGNGVQGLRFSDVDHDGDGRRPGLGSRTDGCPFHCWKWLELRIPSGNLIGF